MSGKKYPIAEIFGPTIQGEGLEQGIPCHFVRFGGCDFKCDWCDTPHAVLPQAVRQLDKMGIDEILDRLKSLSGHPGWVVLSGGNPALHDLGALVAKLHSESYKVAVETQGTLYKPWLTQVDSLCVSPKPPSSQMSYTVSDLKVFLKEDKPFYPFFRNMLKDRRIFLKIVVFSHADYEWAKSVHLAFPDYPLIVSAGNDAGKTVGNPGREDTRSEIEIKQDLLNKARWLTNRLMVDKAMADVRVQAQFHVLLWANELGR